MLFSDTLFTNPGSRVIELHCDNVIQKLHWFTGIHANLSFSIAAPDINHGVLTSCERHAPSISTVFGEGRWTVLANEKIRNSCQKIF